MYKGFTAHEMAAAVFKGCRYLLLAICLLVVMPAWGAGGVLVIGDTSRAYFRSFSSSLADSLERSGSEITVVDTAKHKAVLLNDGGYRCIVTVGNDAARELSIKTARIPVLHALVTETFANEISLSSNAQSTRIFLLVDQPVSRLVLLASGSMPKRHKLGVIFGPYSKLYRSEVRRQAGNANLTLIEKEISDPAQLSEIMTSFSGTEMLLTLPDPMVVNEGTAKTLILGAYLGNLPLVGYSHALVKAGALMSVHSTPDQLGKQAAEMINAAFWSDTSRKGTRVYPRYYQVSVNYQVASALQIELPSEGELKSRLERMEGGR